ncbi:helix-turn-helix transcriptional regulator [Psychrobacter sp. FDAARGOS_221]|uniref:helix-turn-helix transcriptional regulator n=1 Tax=Psychrobacter sp. FDAARGOS_221 TaxID=1975705 RepID=UPI000BB57440|nr:WYL domain-containing protein [Psychrobacter sp. FDAARGOS_221]PNK59722.1 WYL domain-containing protein [Psychrobacter sp. FDAARGOS_221]
MANNQRWTQNREPDSQAADQNDNASNKTATTARQWELLSLLERGSWRGTQHLHEQLMLAGFEVSLRTIQRDLNALAKRFPIEKNNANPQGWRWRDDAPVQSLPHLNLSQAIAFSMVEANLVQLLPPAILDELRPWFDLARQHLRNSKVSYNWLDRVRIEPATQPLIAPKICRDCQDAIYQAIFKNLQISAKYTSRNKDTPGDYQLNPIAIIQRGVVIYLLATKIDDPEQIIRIFALHRFSSVTVEETESQIPEGFNLTNYLDSGGMGFAHYLFKDLPDHGKNTKVKLVFKGNAGISLIESRLSEDQVVVSDPENDTQTITATINLTSQLVWWLRGFGNQLISIEPEILATAVHQDDPEFP